MALVNVIPVEDAVVAMSVATVVLPSLSTLNFEDELTWKSMKFPVKEAGLAPMNVPEACPPWMAFGPNRTSEDDVAATGFAENTVEVLNVHDAAMVSVWFERTILEEE